MALTAAEITAIADEVVRRLGPVLAAPVAPVAIKPTTPVEVEIAMVRQSGIDPVSYLLARAKRGRRTCRAQGGGG